ncbi:HAD-IIB family hydrolase [Mesobacterium sp. TK19101]|uniref:HAD-IIB family hydrolase n=1 Tax=Mesobacterium hydrothermale TaxID=3111907 RepID=A0ABU6HIZ0_9RHOB|nr:HAD-IIB family hydrolase [Mesobacterium sp. TK19101]MEC3862429.1 HAD-IIB family hydrolase [Mesobacterium sp. TK19101]
MTIVVFTDLDGTLLDHDTYSYAAAAPALNALRVQRIPLILTTSKTAAEVAPLHTELGLGATPAIVENGAGVFRPGAKDGDSDAAYRRIRAVLNSIPRSVSEPFRGFGDMDASELSQITGLPARAATLARQRCHSEPGLWTGTDDQERAFVAALAAHGIAARWGGRFLTLSFGRTKADAMQDIATELAATVTIALGDAPNDREMLESADLGIIVRNDHAPPLPPLSGEADGRILRTDAPGPEGWNIAVLDAVSRVAAPE